MYSSSQNLQLINTYSINNVGDAAIYAALLNMAQDSGFAEYAMPDLLESEETMGRHLGVNYTASTPVHSPSYLAVGGDIFNNARPRLITKQFIKNLAQLRRDPQKTVLFGQSIPRSCQGLSFRCLCHQLNKLSGVVVRDQESFQRLQQAGVKAKLSYDSVFAVKIDPNHIAAVESCATIPLDKLVLISLRSFDHLYPQNSQRFIQQLVSLIQRVNSMGLTPAVILQAHVNHSDSDLTTVKEINQQTPLAVIDPFAMQKQLPHMAPWQIAQAYIAQAKIVVGVRYHTAIFRLLSGKMPFNVFYSNKGEDLSQRLGVPGVRVDDFCVERHFQTILDTEHQRFNADAIVEQVREDFSQAVAKVSV